MKLPVNSSGTGRRGSLDSCAARDPALEYRRMAWEPRACVAVLWMSLAPAASAQVLPIPPLPRLEETLDAREEQARKLAAFYRSISPAALEPEPSRSGRERLADITLPDSRVSEWVQLTVSSRQWSRWQREAERQAAEMPNLSHPDRERYNFGRKIKSREMLALADALATRLQAQFPNKVTQWAVYGLQAYEIVTREVPIELRTDTQAYLSDRLGARRDRRRDREKDADWGDDIPPPGASEDKRDLPASLAPKAAVKLNPRIGFKKDPSVKVGLDLQWRLSQRWRLSPELEYDSRDDDWGVAVMFGATLP